MNRYTDIDFRDVLSDPAEYSFEQQRRALRQEKVYIDIMVDNEIQAELEREGER